MTRVKSARKNTRGDVIRVGFLPTPERMKQDGGVRRIYVPVSPKSAVKDVIFKAASECWLDRYYNRGSIDCDEFAAGIVFRGAWLTNVYGIQAYANVNFAVDAISGAEHDFEKKLDDLRGSERVIRSCLALLTPMQKLAVITVCGQDESLGSTARVKTLRRGLERIWRNRWTGRDLFIKRRIDRALADA